MKILHIFGAVLAVHLAVFLVIFAVPGCRSTGRSPTASPSSVGGAAPPVGGDVSPMTAGPAESSMPSTVTYTPDTSVRFSPTRPGSPVAGAVQAAPVTDVVPAKTYTVGKGDSLWTVAKKHGISVQELAAANKLNPSASLKVGQKLIIAVKAAASSSSSGASTAAAAASGETAGPTHVVKGGETLGGIARQHATTLGTLKRLNNLRSDTVRVGQVLVLPDSGSVMPETTPVKGSMATATKSAGGFKHTVKPGETLDAIRRLYNISVGALATANNITDPSKIRPGQELIIPGRSGPKTTTPAPAPTQPESKPAPAPEPLADPFLPVPTEPEPAIRPVQEVPVIRIEDTPPSAP